MKIFKDRKAAGQILAKSLKDTKVDLVLGIPRGGVVVATEIAKALKLPLEAVVVRKIGAPGQEELALGAVDPDGEVVWEEALIKEVGINKVDLEAKIQKEIGEIKRREEVYRSGREIPGIQGKKIILVDDGIATGATTVVAVKYLKRHGAKVILAVPVASKDALEKIKPEVSEIVVLETPQYFQAVGQFYHEFPQVSDEEVVQLLENGRSSQHKVPFD